MMMLTTRGCTAIARHCFVRGALVAGLALLADWIRADALPREGDKAVSVSLDAGTSAGSQRVVQVLTVGMAPFSSSDLSSLRRLGTTKPGPRQQSQLFVVDKPHPKDGDQARLPRNSPASCFLLGFECSSYSLSRVANTTVNSQATTALQPAAGMPYAATGRLHVATTNPAVFDRVCTAALIGRGIIATAGNCVSKPGAGSQGIAKAVRFIPANTGNTLTSGPYGAWAGAAITVPRAYASGTDICLDKQKKRGCINDIAVILLAKNSNGIYPSGIAQISYYRYGDARYGCVEWVDDCQSAVLAYSSRFDAGTKMQRLDAKVPTGYLVDLNRIGILTSPLGNGSEGSPGIRNLGTQPLFTGGAAGNERLNNVVIGIISWHSFLSPEPATMVTLFGWNTLFRSPEAYVSDGINYGKGNIGYLVNEVCRSNGPAHLRGKPKGACLTAN